MYDDKPTLRGRDLGRTFGEGETQTVALRDVSLDLYRGQIVLLKGPAFCFADEPTSALDWAHGEQVIELLRAAAHERGSTILIVSHDARIVPFADRVYHLEDGNLLDPEPAAGHALRSIP